MDTERKKPISVWAKQAARVSLQSLNYLLWPAVCNDCGAAVCDADGGLCKNCWDELSACTASDYCPRCGRDVSKYAIVQGACPNCQGWRIDFDGIARAGIYENVLRRMILAFKDGHTELDSLLGSLADASLVGSSFCDQVELFVPVPLHWSRRLIRGYNQSMVIAKKLVHPTAKISADLVRIHRTKPQTSFDDHKTWVAKRAANVAGAFAVSDGHDFAGRTVCLVDDIKTTGATLNECARILKESGASKVFALVLAVAGQNAG